MSKTITTEGEQAMQLALFHADAAQPGWSDIAFLALCAFALEQQGASFTIEEMRNAVKIESPTDERAWGGVVQRASRLGLIVRVGYAPATSSHGSPKPLWSSHA